MRIYNPTYGALLEFDETKPANPKEVGRWVLSYVSRDRGLLLEEIEELKRNGKVGFYPDEFYLIGKEEWTEEKVKEHMEAVRRFELVNENGPEIYYKDTCGNDQTRIRVFFVAGEIVNTIQKAQSDREAVEKVCAFVISYTQKAFSKLDDFQRKARSHAFNLVMAVRHFELKPKLEKQSTLGEFLRTCG